jgi:hypothetical protein
MTILIGLALIVLLMLTWGMGMVAALSLWAIAIAYVGLTPMPNMVFATWLTVAGLVAFLVQVALGLTPPKKDDKKK